MPTPSLRRRSLIPSTIFPIDQASLFQPLIYYYYYYFVWNCSQHFLLILVQNNPKIGISRSAYDHHHILVVPPPTTLGSWHSSLQSANHNPIAAVRYHQLTAPTTTITHHYHSQKQFNRPCSCRQTQIQVSMKFYILVLMKKN